MKRRRIILAVAFVAVLAGWICWAVATRPPALPDLVYDGKPLSYWLTQPVITDAGAIQIAFVTPTLDSNAVPYLVQVLKTYRDGPLRVAYTHLWLRFPGWLQNRPSLNPFTRADIRGNSIEHLGRLGAAARPAIPELIRVLRKDDARGARLSAAWALGNVANGADKPVVKALAAAAASDADFVVRQSAGAALWHLNPAAATEAGVTNPDAGTSLPAAAASPGH